MNQTGYGKTGESLKEITRAKLLRFFPYKELLGPDVFTFEEGEEIREAVVDANLAVRLPTQRFFRTRLTTSYEEYAFIDIIVAISVVDYNDVRILTAPSFRPESPEFFELFYGLKAPKGNERRILTRGIAGLLQSLTHEGSLGEMEEVEEGRSVLNLYRGSISQNLLVFEFDDSDKLVAILVKRGSACK